MTEQEFRRTKEYQDIMDQMACSPIEMGQIIYPEMAELPSPKFHYEIEADFLATSHDTTHGFLHELLSYIAPRDHAKSSEVGFLFPMWHIFLQERYLFLMGLRDSPEPEPKFIVIQSKTQSEAKRRLGTIKDSLEHSEDTRRFFGYHGRFTAQKWTDTEIKLSNGTTILAVGTGQQVVGLKEGHRRPTLIILDDPEDLENTKTVEAMENNMMRLQKGLVPAKDKLRGRVLVIGTPQRDGCMVLRLQEYERWHTRHYSCFGPVYKNEDGQYYIPTMEKEALWPERYPLKDLMAMKRDMERQNKLSYFYSEYVCLIIGDEDKLFNEEDIQSYQGFVRIENGYHYLYLHKIGGKRLDKPEVRAVNVFMGVDPASSTSQRADYTAIVPVAVDENWNVFVLPYFHGRERPMEVAERVVSWYERYLPLKTKAESVGYQEMLRDYLLHQEGLFIPGLETKEIPRSSKSTRLESLQPYVAQRRFYIQENMTELKNEMILYPRGSHDDLLDGLWYALKGAYKPYHSSEQRLIPKRGNVSVEDWQVV